MDINKATTRFYELLFSGECEMDGKRRKIKGDLNKLPFALGLTAREKALLSNYHFMSGMLAGTRQIRRRIRYLIFSSLVVYGLPVFITFSPSERHCGLAIHLYRGRRKDLAYNTTAHDAHAFKPYLGYQHPSLHPDYEMDEHVVVELPEYDLRRLMTARDPLCCVHAFIVLARLVFPSLHGFRMCPRCPHCSQTGVKSKQTFPCMDQFGSNATPMGGGMGRGDGMIGAVEAQKSEGAFVPLAPLLLLAVGRPARDFAGVGRHARAARVEHGCHQGVPLLRAVCHVS